MTLYINAWLDCTDPKITINNRTTNETLAHFSSLEVDELFASGEITLDELSSNDLSVQQELIKTLFLSRIMINLKQDLTEMGANLKYKRELASFPEMRSLPSLVPAVAATSISLSDLLIQQGQTVVKH